MEHQDYRKPTVERFGSFRDLTRLAGCDSGFMWWSYGCNDAPPPGGEGGGGTDTGRS